jgi:flagellar hook-length control protein FliK
VKDIFSLIGILAIVAAISFHQGYLWEKGRTEAASIKQAAQNAEKVAQIRSETEEKTRANYENQIKNLKRKLSGGCVLGPDYVVLHDTATGLPESASAQTITSEAFARHVASVNYPACLQNAIWLEECNRICQ